MALLLNIVSTMFKRPKTDENGSHHSSYSFSTDTILCHPNRNRCKVIHGRVLSFFTDYSTSICLPALAHTLPFIGSKSATFIKFLKSSSIRILYMPSVYAIISFLSYRFFRSYTYYSLTISSEYVSQSSCFLGLALVLTEPF